MALAVGQFTIIDFNDIDISKTAPSSPRVDQLWLDSSVVPNQLKRWDGTKWVVVNDVQAELDALVGEITDVSQALTDLDGYVNGAFHDGVISQAEARAIEKYINIIEAEKADVDAKYTKLYANTLLAGTAKTGLYSAKSTYNTAHTNLISAINTAISDGKATNAEKTNVDAKFTAYRTALTNLSTAFETASAYLVDAVNGKIEGPGGVLTRLTTVENRTTKDAIIGTVSEELDLDGDPFFARSSKVKQTVNNWTAKFSQVGSTNMIRGSENLTFNPFGGSQVLHTRNVSVPEWGTNKALMINASTGDGNTNLKAFVVLYNDPVEMSGKTYTLSVYAKNERNDATVTIGSLRFGSVTLEPGESRRITITGSNTNDAMVQIQISAQTPAHYARVTLWHPQLETGSVSTDWSPHPEELYAGSTEIDRDGIRVSREGTEVSTSIAYDGVRIQQSNSGTPIAAFTTDGVDADLITARDIRSSSVARVLSRDVTVFVGASETGDGSGKDTNNKSSSVARALNTALDGAVYLWRYPTITINLTGSINELVNIRGISGHGRILLTGDSSAKVVGTIQAMNTNCLVEIDSVQVVNGEDSSNQLIIGNNASRVLIRNCTLDGFGKGYGVGANASNVHVIGCKFFRLERALTASVNGNIHADNIGGSGCQYVASAVYGGQVSLSGTRVAFNTALSLIADGGSFIDNSTGLNTLNLPGYSAPTWTTKTVTFDAEAIYTENISNSYIWNRSEWRQGTWEGNGNPVKGTAEFGSQVKDWLNGSGGYSGTPTIRISAKRNSSSGNKGNGSVSMKITNPSTFTLPAIPYGGGAASGTTTTTLRNLIMNSSNLKLSSSTTSQSDYGAFYDIKIIVTALKKV